MHKWESLGKLELSSFQQRYHLWLISAPTTRADCKKVLERKKINIERDNKVSCQKGQGTWEKFLSQITRLVWFLFPSDLYILMEKNQFILLSQGLWPHMLNAWSQPALSPYKILPKLIKMSMLMSLLRALSFKIPLTGKGHRRDVVKAVAGTCYFMPGPHQLLHIHCSLESLQWPCHGGLWKQLKKTI